MNKLLNLPIAPSSSVHNYILNNDSFMIDKLKNKNAFEFEKKYPLKCLPLFITTNYNDKKEYEWKCKIINRKLNIINVLNLLELMERIKKVIDTDYNLSLNNNNNNYENHSNTNIFHNSTTNYNKNFILPNTLNNLNNSSSLRIIP